MMMYYGDQFDGVESLSTSRYIGWISDVIDPRSVGHWGAH